jgi:hypothetical protein
MLSGSQWREKRNNGKGKPTSLATFRRSNLWLTSPLLFLLRYKRKRSKKKIPNKSPESFRDFAGFVDSRALLTQFSIELRGSGFYATWEGRQSTLLLSSSFVRYRPQSKHKKGAIDTLCVK